MTYPGIWSPGGVTTRRFRLRLLADDPAGAGDGAISPDGTRFVASSRRTGTLNLWLYDIGPQQWHQVTRGPGDDIEGQWSPDTSRLAFTSSRSGRKSIWLCRLSDGELTQLTNSRDEDEYPGWSPDGKMIAYTGGAWGRRHFYLVPAAGGTPRALTHTPGRAGACSFTPDGQRVVCHSYDTGAGAVSLLALDGRHLLLVSDGSAWDYKPTMCATHPIVAFARSLEGRSVVRVQRVDTRVGRALTTGSGDDRWPTWTRDGQSLFFHRLVDRGVAITVWSRHTGAVRDVVGADEQPRYASFDPTGEHIVYGAEISGVSQLRIRALAGGAPRVLPVGEAAFPQWSPDGATIAYAGRDGTSPRWQVATYDLATGGIRIWTHGVPELKGMHGPLDWSPDSTRLIFKCDTEPFEADLCVLDVHTGAVWKVTEDPWWDEAPSWSPDGESVLFMSTRGGEWTWGFFRKHLRTGEVETLAGPDYVEKNHPRMLADGTLLCTLVTSGREELHERPPGQLTRQVPAAGADLRYPVASRDGRQVVLTRTYRTIEYWLAENVWAPDSPVADLASKTVPPPHKLVNPAHPPLGPVKSPVDTRRR
ncbi:hypothetical protein [Streptomyces sp. NPDC042319]|uniref:hypothetical protein n=1 Tax=Streptomyces sp. NPDC042319 TaxID=3154332 RepID=UPI00340AC3F7